MSPEAGATDPKPKTGSTLAAEKVLAPSLLGRVMTALALGVQGLGLLGLALAVIAFLIGIVVLGPAQIFAATVDEIWFYTNPYSLDLFQVFRSMHRLLCRYTAQQGCEKQAQLQVRHFCLNIFSMARHNGNIRFSATEYIA